MLEVAWGNISDYKSQCLYKVFGLVGLTVHFYLDYHCLSWAITVLAQGVCEGVFPPSQGNGHI